MRRSTRSGGKEHADAKCQRLERKRSGGGQQRRQLTDPDMGVIEAGGQLNPDWVEWLMGWPVGWTDLKPLGMDKFQQWLHLHGVGFTRD